MSFDIAQNADARSGRDADEQVLAEDLQKRVAEALSDAEKQPEVVVAAEAQQAAAERLENCASRAARSESVCEGRARTAARGASDATVDVLIESAAEKSKPEFRKTVRAVAAIENQNRYASRALEQIAEHRIPLAQMVTLRRRIARDARKGAGDRADRAGSRGTRSGADARSGDGRDGAAGGPVEGRGGRAARARGGAEAARGSAFGKRGRTRTVLHGSAAREKRDGYERGGEI